MCRFLKLAVEYAIGNRARELKEYLIGVEVFDRNESYDPRLDPVVRVEARRLRAKLASYYSKEGCADELLIELPKGSYAPSFLRRGAGGAPEAERAEGTIAVLPFSNLTKDGENEYFSDGLTQELTHLLTKVEGLRVVAWNSAARFKDNASDPISAGERLKARFILTGSVRRKGEQLRITAQLADSKTGFYLWSEAYDRGMSHLFAIQEEISQAIVRTLKKTLVPKPAHSQACLEAYNCYLKGRFHLNKRTEAAICRSIEHFREAIALDGAFAMAYSGLADSYTLLADYGLMLPAAAIRKAEEAARKAVELEPTLGEAEASLGLIRSLHSWEWKKGEEHFLRAIELNPNYASAHQWFALDCLAVQGRMEEAREHIAIACDLDPLTPNMREGVGYLRLFDRDYDGAIEQYREILELDPYFYKAYTSMGRALMQKGQYAEAIQALEKGRALGGDIPSLLGALGQAHAFAGEREEALHLLRALHAVTTTRYVPSTSIALLHLALGEKEDALQQLEAGCERRDLALASLKMHPAYDPLRGEPRFERLVRIVGL